MVCGCSNSSKDVKAIDNSITVQKAIMSRFRHVACGNEETKLETIRTNTKVLVHEYYIFFVVIA